MQHWYCRMESYSRARVYCILYNENPTGSYGAKHLTLLAAELVAGQSRHCLNESRFAASLMEDAQQENVVITCQLLCNIIVWFYPARKCHLSRGFQPCTCMNLYDWPKQDPERRGLELQVPGLPLPSLLERKFIMNACTV